jgi:hypothetical protein
VTTPFAGTASGKTMPPLTARTRQRLTYLLVASLQFNPPLYSPDLNLIEHVWNRIKNWIEEHYWHARYDAAKIRLDQLQRIVQGASDSSEALPDIFKAYMITSGDAVRL